jgi:ABC-type phosphate transport system substrate-binding protein
MMFSLTKNKTAIAILILLTFTGLSSVASAATIVSGGEESISSLIESCRLSFAGDVIINAAGDKTDYATVGSGTGRANFFKNDYIFALTANPWRNSEVTTAQSTTGGANRTLTNFVFIPMISTPIAVVYKLDGIRPAGTAVQMSSATVAKIFAGQITKWNDPAIIADNPPMTQINAAIQQPAQPRLSALKGKIKVTVSKTKNPTKASLTVTISSAAVTKTTKNLVITSTIDDSKTVRKIYNKKPKAGKLTISVPYQSGAVYIVKYDGKTLGNVSIDSREVAVPNTSVSIEFPDTAITVVKRKETTETTNNFVNYLNKTQSTIWSKTPSDAFDSSFPGVVPIDGSFVAAQTNDGVVSAVLDRDGSIGYAELFSINERRANGVSISTAKIKNGAGEFVAPSSSGIKLALSMASVDSTTGVVTHNYENTLSGAYPISFITYGLANTSGVGTTVNNTIARNFVNYVLNTCAPKMAKIKGHADLPDNILNASKMLAAKIGV